MVYIQLNECYPARRISLISAHLLDRIEIHCLDTILSNDSYFSFCAKAVSKNNIWLGILCCCWKIFCVFGWLNFQKWCWLDLSHRLQPTLLKTFPWFIARSLTHKLDFFKAIQVKCRAHSEKYKNLKLWSNPFFSFFIISDIKRAFKTCTQRIDTVSKDSCKFSVLTTSLRQSGLCKSLFKSVQIRVNTYTPANSRTFSVKKHLFCLAMLTCSSPEKVFAWCVGFE